MIEANDLRKGVTFELDGNLYKVLEYAHNKPGRGLATIRIKARDLRSGVNIEKTFSSNERVQDVRLDHHMVQYLYKDGENYVFMDLQTYEQTAISAAILDDATNYLTENMEVKLTFYEEKPLDIELPTAVELKIVQADMAVRGDTATGVNKMVSTETGLQVQVPGFVNEGDTIKVDTRTGEYLTRV
jgi:elongation factor P